MWFLYKNNECANSAKAIFRSTCVCAGPHSTTSHLNGYITKGCLCVYYKHITQHQQSNAKHLCNTKGDSFIIRWKYKHALRLEFRYERISVWRKKNLPNSFKWFGCSDNVLTFICSHFITQFEFRIDIRNWHPRMHLLTAAIHHIHRNNVYWIILTLIMKSVNFS